MNNLESVVHSDVTQHHARRHWRDACTNTVISYTIKSFIDLRLVICVVVPILALVFLSCFNDRNKINIKEYKGELLGRLIHIQPRAVEVIYLRSQKGLNPNATHGPGVDDELTLYYHLLKEHDLINHEMITVVTHNTFDTLSVLVDTVNYYRVKRSGIFELLSKRTKVNLEFKGWEVKKGIVVCDGELVVEEVEGLQRRVK